MLHLLPIDQNTQCSTATPVVLRISRGFCCRSALQGGIYDRLGQPTVDDVRERGITTSPAGAAAHPKIELQSSNSAQAEQKPNQATTLVSTDCNRSLANPHEKTTRTAIGDTGTCANNLD